MTTSVDTAASEPIPPEFRQWFERAWASYLDKAFIDKVTSMTWALKTWRHLSTAPTTGSAPEPNFCENCAMDLVTCDCVIKRPAYVETATDPDCLRTGVPDACEVCNGSKGGTPGNENVIDGKIVCDYCHAAPAPTTGSAPVAWQVQRIDPEEGVSIWREASISEYLMRFDSPHWNVRELFAAPPANAPVASVLTDWQHRCAVLVDIYDDARNNAPEDRCYVDGAFTAEMDEVRAILAASMGGGKS